MIPTHTPCGPIRLVYNPGVAESTVAQEDAPPGRFWHLLRGRLTRDERQQVYLEIRDGSTPSSRFYILIVLSTIIASYGLLANSTAVVIGAMLVAPLMGPIFGISLALISGNLPLLRRAIFSTALGIVLTVGVAMLIGLVPMSMQPGSEMFGRTAPTLYDLFIAVASGLAGAYALANPKVATALPGVAVSVALAPPLATCGLFLARGSLELGAGAFLLFLTNLFGIQLAGCVVFFLYNLGAEREVKEVGPFRFVMRFAPSIVAIALMGWYLTITLQRVSAEGRLRTTIQNVLTEEFARRSGSRLEEILSLGHADGRWDVVVSVLTPKPLTTSEIDALQKLLERKTNQPIYLIVRSIQSQDADANGPVFALPSELEQSERLRRDAEIAKRITEGIQSYLGGISGASLVDVAHSEDGNSLRVQATVAAPEPITPQQVNDMESSLSQLLGRPVAAEVRTVLSRSADAKGWLYVPEGPKPPPISPEERAIRGRLEAAIRRRLEALPGVTVTEIAHREGESGRTVTATVEAPEPISPEVVAQLQADLRRYVNPQVQLVVMTRLVVRPRTNENSR